jgi:hypothetical protein
MAKTLPPQGNPDLTGDELQAVRDVKVGKPVTPEMQARLTQLKLAEERPGGFSLTNEGELRLVRARVDRRWEQGVGHVSPSRSSRSGP